MSAPIPSFFKIRCVLVILSFLLFFLLIGMARFAFAVCSGTQSDGSCVEYTYTCTDGILSTPYTLVTSIDFNSGCSPVVLSTAPFPKDTPYCAAVMVRKWRRAAGASTWLSVGVWNFNPIVPGSINATFVSNINDTSLLDCSGDCTDELARATAQCGQAGVWPVDPDACEYRCGDCVAEATYECPEPYIILWNDDGECSYNCSLDTDGDGVPDLEDLDDDNDGLQDPDDPCPTNSDLTCKKPLGPDTDGDGTPDVSDPDADMDGDGLKNSEDDDDDGDGVKDVSDFDADPDGDGYLNIDDNDDDGDGKSDEEDPDADPDGDGETNEEDEDDDNDNVPDIDDPDKSKYSSQNPAYSFSSTLPEMLKARFQQFLDDVKMGSLFSIPERIKQGVPSGGDSSLTIDMGETFGGQHDVDFSGWSQGLAALNAIIYIVCSGIAIRIIILKR